MASLIIWILYLCDIITRVISWFANDMHRVYAKWWNQLWFTWNKDLHASITNNTNGFKVMNKRMHVAVLKAFLVSCGTDWLLNCWISGRNEIMCLLHERTKFIEIFIRNKKISVEKQKTSSCKWDWPSVTCTFVMIFYLFRCFRK